MREHTVIIKPPRALWVPFELGRPLGAPNHPPFQTLVLRHALQLLEAPGGPVLADFPHDAPTLPDAPDTLVCPVNFAPPVRDLSQTEALCVALQQEIAQLRTWYDLAVSRRGRTTLGVSGFLPEELGTFIGGFLDSAVPPNPRQDVPLATLFRYAVEDLKAYYWEAVTAQPGQHTASSHTLADWFWRETTAARVLFAIQEAAKRSNVPGLQVVTTGFLIPRARSADSPYARV